MGMTDIVFFPADVALAAMGNTSKRWQSHLEQGKIYIESGFQAHKASGPGRGRKRQISLEAVVQGAIALALVDAGTKVEVAYRIGADFAYSSKINGPRLTDAGAPLEPAKDRFACKLFGQGQTLLVYAVGAGYDEDGALAIVSDADPAVAGVDGFGQATMLIDCVNSADGSPRVVMNLTLLCAQIAKSLDIDFQRAFGWVSA
ncbi:hypothetical protein K3758_12890 [Sulfitobacter sp. W002]|uniref:hypothetical protein n=1 Tax=Sulfitobacter sp. W002 TaxID=2867024 RepID=UPI0021A67A19|nr:hypothetical protein [Sulfitobacter sp. W002]UWR29243.1 hypothetical protein K3758_12890 [Sulfitobacter sp. W002]